MNPITEQLKSILPFVGTQAARDLITEGEE